jgi:hypothetical protein
VLHIHHHLSSGAGTLGQLVADVPSGLSLTPPQETKKKNIEVTSNNFNKTILGVEISACVIILLKSKGKFFLRLII